MSEVIKKNNATEDAKPRVMRVVASSIFWPLAIFFVAQVVVAIALTPFIPALSNSELEPSILETFIYSATFELLALTLVVLFLKWKKHNLKWLGLGKLKLEQLKPLLPAIGVYVVVTIGAFILVSMLIPEVNLDQAQDVGFEEASSSLEIILAFVALVIVTPVTEEILMRGMMFRGLNRVMSFSWAAFLSAGIFALLHGQLNVGIDTFILGLVLAWLVNKTNSLWPAILLHMLKNMVAFSFLYLL